MDEIGTRAVIIGVGILVTLIIVTVVIFEFTEIQRAYRITAETDISFEERLDELDKYRDSNNDFTGLDVKNTVAKYKENKLIEVCLQDGTLRCSDINIDTRDYNKKYKSNLEQINNISRIIFTAR